MSEQSTIHFFDIYEVFHRAETMRYEFVRSVFQKLLRDQEIQLTNSLLAVCAGLEERRLFLELGFAHVTISNVDSRLEAADYFPYQWKYQDAENLTFVDEQFDFVFVSDGLHHCASPHRALLEMYRVARYGIIVFEARDSLLIRLASRLGFSAEYELEAVAANDCAYGGLRNTDIPNYVYRWTERELQKTIQAYHPIGRHRFRFFHGLSLPTERLSMGNNRLKWFLSLLIGPAVRLLTAVFSRQCNLLAMFVRKPRPEDLWPWITIESGHPQTRKEVLSNRFKATRVKRTER